MLNPQCLLCLVCKRTSHPIIGVRLLLILFTGWIWHYLVLQYCSIINFLFAKIWECDHYFALPLPRGSDHFCGWGGSAAQKIKKLSETPVTVHNIAKLCVIDGKNREITKKLVQPVPPHPCWTHGNFNGKMTKKIKWPKITFPGSKMIPKVSKWGF